MITVPATQVADAVAEQGADERRGPPDRQRAEPVDDAAGQVGVQRDARVDRREDDAHRQHPGHQVVEVVAGRARDRPAEEVGEHEDEHDRRDRHVEQLLGDVPDLQHPAPAEGDRRREATGRRRLRRRARPPCGRRRVGGGRRSGRGAIRESSDRGCSRGLSLLVGLSSDSLWSSAAWPVSARKTSSRLGWPSEKSPMPIPALAQLATRRRRRGRRRRTARSARRDRPRG